MRDIPAEPIGAGPLDRSLDMDETMNPRDLTTEEFRSFCIDELNGILSLPLAVVIETKVQRALVSAAIAYLAQAPIGQIALLQSHYVNP